MAEDRQMRVPPLVHPLFGVRVTYCRGTLRFIIAYLRLFDGFLQKMLCLICDAI